MSRTSDAFSRVVVFPCFPDCRLVDMVVVRKGYWVDLEVRCRVASRSAYLANQTCGCK